MSTDFLAQLSAHRQFGIKPGLKTMEILLDALGHPEADMAVMHIAGTNGKGSVAAICETALRTFGYPVGRYTSPHLLRVNERFFVHGQPVSDQALQVALDQVEDAIQATGVEATFFEVLTAAAWLIFKAAGIKIAIVEVGLGGRFDATNTIAQPLVSVITRIALDHCSILGDSLDAIATEKAGIIKPGRPVIIGAMPDEARTVIKAIAAHNHAPIVDATQTVSVTSTRRSVFGQTFKIVTDNCAYPSTISHLTGAYQAENVATAVCALEALINQGLDVPIKAIVEGIGTAFWPGRFQLIGSDPAIFLDGGHNPDGVRALVDSLKSVQVRKNVALVAGFCADKSILPALKAIAPVTTLAWAVPVQSDRAIPQDQLVALMNQSGIRHASGDLPLAEAIEAATDWAADHNGTVVICGSLFLVGEVLALRGEAPWEADRVDPNESINPTI